MNTRPLLRPIAITALVVVGLVAMGAIFVQYPGLIEFQCSAKGCRVVIDGRSR